MRQLLPLTHWALLVQAVGQLAEVPPHTYGEQEGLPALPEARGLQVPTLPVRLQASQVPAQAELQHTPSTQLPLEHWLAAPQTAPPFFLGTQAPPEQ